jgi:hypothetical protein
MLDPLKHCTKDIFLNPCHDPNGPFPEPCVHQFETESRRHTEQRAQLGILS